MRSQGSQNAKLPGYTVAGARDARFRVPIRRKAFHPLIICSPYFCSPYLHSALRADCVLNRSQSHTHKPSQGTQRHAHTRMLALPTHHAEYAPHSSQELSHLVGSSTARLACRLTLTARHRDRGRLSPGWSPLSRHMRAGSAPCLHAGAITFQAMALNSSRSIIPSLLVSSCSHARYRMRE